MNACVRGQPVRYRDDAPFSDCHSGEKSSRDSTFGEAHISYMRKTDAVNQAPQHSSTEQLRDCHQPSSTRSQQTCFTLCTVEI